MGTLFSKKLTHFAVLATLSLSPLAQADWLDKQMFTLNPKLQIYGPVQGTLLSHSYQTKVFRIILEEAHEQAREYLSVGDFEGYWGFIIAALTVPLHEGSNIHFRKVENDGTKCQERSNSGSIFSGSAKYTATFKRIFKEGSSPALPECSVVNNDELVHQLLHGHDGSDLGIMQVNLYWHERNYLSVGDWKSVRNTIRYGLGLLKNGYSGVYRNSHRYSCVQSSDGVSYDNLIRAAWAGVYNSGNLASSCRFANPNSDWARNDINFHNSLKKIKSLDEADNRRRSYKLEDREDTLMEQVISHYKNKTQSAAVLTDYLVNTTVSGTDFKQPLLNGSVPPVVTDPVEPDHPPTPPVVTNPTRVEISPMRIYKVTASTLNFRDGPGRSHNDCGGLPKNTEVIVKAIDGDWIELLEDEMLAYYFEDGHKCGNTEKYAHKDYLVDLGPLYDEEPAVVVVAPTPTPSPTPTPEVPVITEQRTMGKANGWAKVREDRPHGYTMAPATGQVIGPAGQEVIIAETIWNSSNSKHPWYRLSSPVKGWVYGKYVDVEGEN